jgi:hypothetical protein
MSVGAQTSDAQLLIDFTNIHVQATLISVKMVGQDADLTNAFNYILDNLRAHRMQQGRSVVITSTGVGSQETYANSQNSPIHQRLYKQPIQ